MGNFLRGTNEGKFLGDVILCVVGVKLATTVIKNIKRARR